MKLRRNHVKSNVSLGVPKMIVFVLILLGLLYFIYKGLLTFQTNSDGYQLNLQQGALEELQEFLPSSKGEIISHDYYTLSYMEDIEQAEWVCYKLTDDMLRMPNVDRAKRFEEDPKVSTQSANYYDYRGSGYTRGHLAPAGDMAHNKEAMEQSFFMSNISPQIRSFNNGIWKELEEQVRDWVYHNEELYIVSGPIITEKRNKVIGKAKVVVPQFFYKVVLSVNKNKEKSIAFLIPHEKSTFPLQHYAISVNSLESITDINFFPNLSEIDIEKIENHFNLSEWKFSDARYKLRIERWNNQ